MSDSLQFSRLVRVRDASEQLAMCKNGVRMLITDGLLPAINLSKGRMPRYRIRQEDLDAFLRSRYSGEVSSNE